MSSEVPLPIIVKTEPVDSEIDIDDGTENGFANRSPVKGSGPGRVVKTERVINNFKHNIPLLDPKKVDKAKEALEIEQMKAYKVHTCDQCSFTTISKNLLREHKFVHTGEKPWPCHLCNYKAKYRMNLRNHMLMTHSGYRPFSCQVCEYNAPTRGLLREHTRQHRGDKDKPLVCKECPARFAFPCRLKDHIDKRHSKKKYYCFHCSFVTGKKNKLKAHVVKHENEERKCTYCRHEDATHAQLWKHIKKEHSDELPFACRICHYRGPRELDVQRHMKTHPRKKTNQRRILSDDSEEEL